MSLAPYATRDAPLSGRDGRCGRLGRAGASARTGPVDTGRDRRSGRSLEPPAAVDAESRNPRSDGVFVTRSVYHGRATGPGFSAPGSGAFPAIAGHDLSRRSRRAGRPRRDRPPTGRDDRSSRIAGRNARPPRSPRLVQVAELGRPTPVRRPRPVSRPSRTPTGWLWSASGSRRPSSGQRCRRRSNAPGVRGIPRSRPHAAQGIAEIGRRSIDPPMIRARRGSCSARLRARAPSGSAPAVVTRVWPAGRCRTSAAARSASSSLNTSSSSRTGALADELGHQPVAGEPQRQGEASAARPATRGCGASRPSISRCHSSRCGPTSVTPRSISWRRSARRARPQQRLAEIVGVDGVRRSTRPRSASRGPARSTGEAARRPPRPRARAGRAAAAGRRTSSRRPARRAGRRTRRGSCGRRRSRTPARSSALRCFSTRS